MKKSTFLIFLLFAGLIIVTSCKKDDDGGTSLDCTTITYSSDIAPLIASKCSTAGCHDAGSVVGDYTTYAGIETKAKNGDMEKAVITDKTMPKSGTLSQTELDKIQCWLDAGAPNN